jgi:WD40 repeat protein
LDGIRIWTTNDATQLLKDLEIELPALHIWLMLASAFHLVEADEEEFRAHVSFSPDLNTIMVLHSVIRITENEYHIQSLGDDELGQIQEKIKRLPHRFYERDLKITQAIIAESLLSKQGNLLAVVTSDSPHCGPNLTDHYDCSIRLDHNVSTADESPHYRRIAQGSSLDWIGGRSKLMIIHPSNSCIVFVHKKGTFLWNISDLGFNVTESTPNLELKHLTKLCVERLDGLSFSACGRSLPDLIQTQIAIFASLFPILQRRASPLQLPPHSRHRIAS